MDRPADVWPEHGVDAAMLLDPAQTGELRCGYGGAEMVAAAGEVGDLGTGARDRGLDTLPKLVSGRHH